MKWISELTRVNYKMRPMLVTKSVQIKIEPPLSILRAKYRARKQELRHMKTANTMVSIFLDRWVQKNFQSQGGNVGGWKPLARGGRWVKGYGIDPSAKVLQDTGRLRSSFIPWATNTNAGIGSNLPYSAKHEYGEDGLPVRRMLPKRKEVIPQIRKIYVNFVKKVMRK